MRKLAGKFFGLHLVASLLLFASPLLAQDDTPFKIKPQGQDENKQWTASAYELTRKKFASNTKVLVRTGKTLREDGFMFTGSRMAHATALEHRPHGRRERRRGVSPRGSRPHLGGSLLWHGGEGEPSKEAFRTMTATDRAALIKFLKSL